MENILKQEQLNMLYQITQELIAQQDLTAIFSTFVKELEKIKSYDLYALFTLEGDQLVALTTSGKLAKMIPEKHRININEGIAGLSIQNEQIIYCNDVTQSPNYINTCQLPISSELVQPLFFNNMMFGAFIIASQERNSFTQEDISYFQNIAKIFSFALQSAIINEHNHAVNNITYRLLNYHSFPTNYQAVLTELLTIVPFDHFLVTYPNKFRSDVINAIPLYYNNNFLTLKKGMIKRASSISEKMNKSLFYLLETIIKSDYAEEQFMGIVEGVTVLRIPIIINDKLVAILHFYRNNNNFNLLEIDTILKMALLTGPVIEQLIIAEFNTEMERIKNYLHRKEQQILSADDIKLALYKTLKGFKIYFHVDQFIAWILNEKTLEFEPLLPKQPIIHLTDHSKLLEAFYQKKEVYYNLLNNLSEIHPAFTGIEGRSALIIPLCDEILKQCFGLVLAYDHKNPLRFNDISLTTAKSYLKPLGNVLSKTLELNQLLRHNEQLVKALAIALDKKDAETYGHSERVVAISLAIAKRMNLTKSVMKRIELGALLHDIGKIGIPDAILLKPGKLTAEEWEIMRKHPLIGYEMIKEIEFLEEATDIVLYHHEHYDGNGYPFGLIGDEIPLSARIFAIADAFDAITSSRPYKKPLSIEQARLIIYNAQKTHFCPQAVKAFMSVPLEELKEIIENTVMINKEKNHLSI